MSTLFLRTLRDDPADAEVPSHRLLVRGGYIRRAAPGGFTWLPIGWITYQHVAADRLSQGQERGTNPPRGDERRRLPGGPLPGPPASRAVRGFGALDRLR